MSRAGDPTPEWLNGLDSSSIDEIVATVRSFVAAFPQKTDGLSLLVVTPSGADQIAQRLVDRLRKRDLADLQLELHVLTPNRDHSAVASSMVSFDTEDGRGQLLMPRFRLVLHDWGSDPAEQLSGLKGRVDLAIAPNLFGLNTTPLAETRSRESGLGGAHDPWVDLPTHSRPPAPGNINVSQVLLPSSPDPVLEDWSTLSVRRHNQQPLNANDPDGTDFFTLQVQFDQHEQLFLDLHEVAHWVVTLDPFIGREQIDALKDAPDVLTVKPGVGKNQMYTLVVSSDAGKAWVTGRLAARLEEDFGIDSNRADALAARLYEIGRQVVPGLMLRAVGLGRTIEEIIGLILARFAMAEAAEMPADGCEYWISLDEHTNWFGGANRMRPDLLRVRATSDGDTTKLDLLVLESKFRQQFDLGVADGQVARAINLFRDGLGKPSGVEADDAPFWRRELVSAIEQLPQRAAAPHDLPPIRKFGSPRREEEIRADIRTGRYVFGEVAGVVSVTAWSGRAEAQVDQHSPGGHRLISIDKERARAILSQIENRQDPSVPSPLDKAQPPAAQSDDSTAEPVEAVSDRRPSDSQSDASITPAEEPDGQPAAEYRREGRLDPLVLESRLQRILDRLDQLGVAARRPNGTAFLEGPGFCSYRILPNAERGVSAQNLTGKIEDLKLALELPAEMSIRSFVDRGAVVFEVPKDDHERYFVEANELLARTTDNPNALSVPFGEDVHGKPVAIDFSSSDTPHLLIAGQTGSGKSVALETILRGLCERKRQEELQLLLIDGKGTELVDFEGSPHVNGDIGWFPEDAIAVLERSVEEMARRYQLFRLQKAKSLSSYNAEAEPENRIPWWLIVLDEYADLTSDPDERKQIESSLKRVAQKGRAAGIHLIVATQKPSAEVLSTVIRSNLPSQLALRVKSSSDSRIILDESGAESLAGKGDGFLKTAKGMTRVQCAMVSSQ